jgi:branched-chain amino acid transport system substrate-binding protein
MRRSKMNRVSGVVVWVAVLLLVGAWASWGQTGSQVEISGTVVFTDGTPAEGVRVALFDLPDVRLALSGITDSQGRFAIALESSSVSGAPVPGTFQLRQNFPNPFNPSTTIPYELQRSSDVRLDIFNVLGQQVRTLVDEHQATGLHTAVWDARDDQGRGVAAGIYFYRIAVDGVWDTQSMVLTDGAASSTAGGWTREQAHSTSSLGGARAYGMTLSGPGVLTYVQPELLLQPGMGPLSFAVERATGQTAAKLTAGETGILGDVNNDGRVSISDALILATYALDDSITIPNNGDITLGDVNRDSEIDISDALMIATYGIDPLNPALPPGIGEPLMGSIQITSTPSGARVQIDGVHTGEITPYTFTDKAAGMYTVGVSLEGYQAPSPQTVDVSLRQTAAAAFTLPLAVVKIGFIYETKDESSARYGAELALFQINQEGGVLGFPLELVIKQSQYDEELAAVLAEELITEEDIVALVGPSYSFNSVKVGPVAQRHGVPMVATSATNPTVTATGDFVFLAAFVDNFQSEVMARFARESLGAQTAALLIEEGELYSEGLAELFEENFAGLGGRVVASETYSGGDTLFTSQLTAIGAEAPDVVFMPGFAPEIPLAVKQARTIPQAGAAGITAAFLGGDGWETPDVVSLGGTAVEGSYFSTFFSLETQDEGALGFVRAYQSMFGIAPDGGAAMGYDALKLVATAMRRAGSLDKEAIRDELAATRGYKGATSILSYDENRHPQKSAVIMQIRDGEFQLHEEVEP